MKISVIIPVYNVYDYIDKCLDSLVNQTLKDIEIIILDLDVIIWCGAMLMNIS